MADKNKVIQLLDPETGGKVSPVVNVGSIYDKKGQKIDNLLSYKVSGMDVPIPEAKNMTDEINKKVDDTLQNVNSKVDNKLASVDDAIAKAGSVIKNAKIPSNISAINAGDVVDVDSSGNVLRNFISEDTRSKVYYIASDTLATGTRIVKMSDKFTIAGLSYGPAYGEAVLIDNESQSFVTKVRVSGYSARGIELIRINDTTALMFYAEYRNQASLLVYKLTIQESSGSYVLNRGEYWSLQDDIGSGWDGGLSICPLTDNKFMLILDTGSGTSMSIISITDGVPSMSVSPIQLKSFNLNFHSVSKLSGNKFVVSGRYGGFAKLFTFETNENWSSVSNVTDISISTTGKVIGHCKLSENSIVISYMDNVSSVNKSVLQKIDFSGNSTILHDPVYVNEGNLGYSSSATEYYFSATVVPTNRSNEFISFHLTESGSSVLRFFVDGDNLKISEPYQYIADECKGYQVSALYVSDEFIPMVYTQCNSSGKYNTIYHHISMNPDARVLGGRFVDRSRDAIALKNGVSGSTIPVGFHGICEMPSAKTGDSIKSINGVSGISPADGWMIVSSKYDHPEGTYVGTGKHSASDPIVLEFDVLPRRIDIVGGNYHGVILIYDNGGFCYGFAESVLGEARNALNFNITVTVSGHNVSFYGYSVGVYSLDEAGVTYHLSLIHI